LPGAFEQKNEKGKDGMKIRRVFDCFITDCFVNLPPVIVCTAVAGGYFKEKREK
jgi:hypothetical protein